MQVELITKTVGYEGSIYSNKSIDQIVVGIARISSNKNNLELFSNPSKLIRHCVSNGHWSIFDTCNLGFNITTSRDIGRQLLRHWAVKKQEYSARYSEVNSIEEIELRYQALKNRQSSLNIVENKFINFLVDKYLNIGLSLYSYLLKNKVAKECARFILPGASTTKMYFNFTVREVITTLNQRLHHTAQKEVRLIAEEIRDIFIKECPIISEALFNFEGAYDIPILDRVILEKYKVYGDVRDVFCKYN